MLLRLAAVLGVLATALPARGEEPWGYVYVFRTMRVFPLTGDEVRLGRLPENDVVLSSSMVSRRHAVIRRGESGAQLIDVGSSNGSRVNTRQLRPRFPVPLEVGSRIQLADELLLYHASLQELWRDELRHRLLTSFVKLRLHLPQDTTRKSFGREEIVSNVTEAHLNKEEGKIEIAHASRLDDRSGFPADSAAFVGSVEVERGVLEVSLWAIQAGSSMTSRRSSLANLRHTTLRISVVDGVSNGLEEDGAKGPWFPSELTGGLFEVYADDPGTALQLSTSLAEQDRPVALRDAAEALAFQHRLEPSEWRLLLLAARSKASFVEREIVERSALLTDVEKKRLTEAVAESRRWLERARALGAEDDWAEDAVEAMTRAEQRLARILDR